MVDVPAPSGVARQRRAHGTRLEKAIVAVVAIQAVLSIAVYTFEWENVVFEGATPQTEDWLALFALGWAVVTAIAVATLWRTKEAIELKALVAEGELVQLVADEAALREEMTAKLQRIEETIARREIRMVYQPIVDISSGRDVGIEALARFGDGRSPLDWFDDASDVSLRDRLEIACIDLALRGCEAYPTGYIAINATPSTLTSAEFLPALVDSGVPLNRAVLELSEQEVVEDYETVRDAIGALREHGIKLAVDDVGAGFSSLAHTIELAPEFIKLDRSMVKSIDKNPGRRAVVSSMVTFAEDLDAVLIAEGVEQEAELNTLREIGVRYAQGYYLGRPGNLPLAA